MGHGALGIDHRWGGWHRWGTGHWALTTGGVAGTVGAQGPGHRWGGQAGDDHGKIDVVRRQGGVTAIDGAGVLFGGRAGAMRRQVDVRSGLAARAGAFGGWGGSMRR